MRRLFFLSLPMVTALSFTIFTPAHAQGFIPEPGTPSQSQYQVPEPPGDGPWTKKDALIPGDTTTSVAPASDPADGTNGVHQRGFGVAIGRDTSVVHLRRTQNVPRTNAQRAQNQGSMMTLRPDQLSASQLGSIKDILGVDLMTHNTTIDVNPTDTQLDQVQQVLAPYPKPGGLYPQPWDKKTDSTSGNGWAGQAIPTKLLNMNATPDRTYYPKPLAQNIYDFQGPLPTVRKLSRLFVLIGVVAATIFMAFAAYSVVLGHREGASRVVGTAAGLLLLLSAYTIWKVVIVNSFAFRGMPDLPLNTALFNRPQVDPVSDTEVKPPDVPTVPGTTNQRPARSGIPVAPLSAQ